MYITKTNKIKNKKCEKGNCKGMIEKRNLRGVLSGWWALEKRAVEVKDLKSNAVKVICICITLRKSSSTPEGCILPCKDGCSWSSTQDELHSGAKSKKNLLCHHLPLLLQLSQARGVTFSLIHLFIQQIFCVWATALCLLPWLCVVINKYGDSY